LTDLKSKSEVGSGKPTMAQCSVEKFRPKYLLLGGSGKIFTLASTITGLYSLYYYQSHTDWLSPYT